MTRSGRLFALGTLLLGGCAGPSPPTHAPPTSPALLRAPVGFTVLADSIPDDPVLESLVGPFREDMAQGIEGVVGEVATTLTKDWPEGTLGNFATDALLWVAGREVDEPVHMALTNNGGLRVPLAQGPITMGKMFELMPFENLVSILVLTGSQVEALAQDIARRGGEPIAGFSFRIEMVGEERVARDVRIGGQSPDPLAHYRLATNDYLANGGDDMPTLLSALERTDLPLLVRDAFATYLREMGVIEARIEGRITGRVRQ